MQKDSYVLGGDHLILREGRAGKFCRDRLFIFSMTSTRKFIFRNTKARLFTFILKKAKKKKNQTQKNPREGGKGGGQNVGSDGCLDQERIFHGIFFIFAHYQVLYVHVHIYYSI